MFCEILPKRGGDDGMYPWCELPFSDLSETGAHIFAEWTVNRDTRDAVGWASESVEIWLCLFLPLKVSRVSDHLVDADHITRSIGHGVPNSP